MQASLRIAQGGNGVTHYRLYWLDGAGKIVTAEWLEAEDDHRAALEAKAQAKGGACEIWERKRLVGLVPPRA